MPTMVGGEEYGGRFGVEQMREELAADYFAQCLARGNDIDIPALDSRQVDTVAREVSAHVFDDYSETGAALFARGFRVGAVVELLSSGTTTLDIPIGEIRGLFPGDGRLFADWLKGVTDEHLLQYPQKHAAFQRWRTIIEQGAGAGEQAYMGYFSAAVLIDIQRNLTEQDERLAARVQCERETFAAMLSPLEVECRKALEVFESVLYGSVGSNDMALFRKVAQMAVVDTFLVSIDRLGLDQYAFDEVAVYSLMRYRNRTPRRKK